MKKRGHSNDRDGRDILVRSRVRLRHANVAETAAASLPTLPYLTLMQPPCSLSSSRITLWPTSLDSLCAGIALMQSVL